MSRMFVCIAGLMAAAGVSHAQSVEFRFVERSNQTIVNTSDSLLELAVQARVTGGSLGAFSFNIAIAGESESFGTLAKARINNANHTYFTGSPWAANSTVGQGGIASQYSFLAAQNAGFNGLFNTSGGSFVNNPAEQEIGIVTGRVMGDPLLGTPGIDPDELGHPATWPGTGTTASLDPAIAGPYFASGQFIDIYRFRYTVSNFSPRTLNFVLRNMLAENFTRFTTNGILWGAQDTTVPSGNISGAPLSVSAVGGLTILIPAPASASLLALGGLLAVRRRRAN